MTTDIDAIRDRAEFSGDPFYAEDTNDLIAEVRELRAELEKVRGQYADTRRHNDLLTAELADQQHANTTRANENARLRKVADAAKALRKFIGDDASFAEEVDLVDAVDALTEAEVAR